MYVTRIKIFESTEGEYERDREGKLATVEVEKSVNQWFAENPHFAANTEKIMFNYSSVVMPEDGEIVYTAVATIVYKKYAESADDPRATVI